MTYEKLKKFFVDNKEKFIQAACFILVFIVGFRAGQFQADHFHTKQYQQVNYTTKKEAKATEPQGEVKGAESPKTPAKPDDAKPATAPADCPIKGNISSAGKKIYHMKGGAFYARTNAEVCFTTESEALEAGFTKSSR